MKTRRKHAWTDTRTQMAVIADRSAGLSCSAVAEKYGIDKATVSRICSRFRNQVPQAELAVDLENYKEQLRRKAIAAIDAALDATFDPYKRGSIGLSVMKGLGDLAGDGAVVQVNHFDIDNIPADLRPRYLRERGYISNEPDEEPSSTNLIGPAPEDT